MHLFYRKVIVRRFSSLTKSIHTILKWKNVFSSCTQLYQYLIPKSIRYSSRSYTTSSRVRPLLQTRSISSNGAEKRVKNKLKLLNHSILMKLVHSCQILSKTNRWTLPDSHWLDSISSKITSLLLMKTKRN